jgi:ketosteroid isomerase-like protein
LEIPQSTYKFLTGKTCPYCQSKIKDRTDFIICSQCGSPHHKECWDENQGCTTYGCKNNPHTIEKLHLSSQDVGDKTVQEIKKEISSGNLIQCPKCKNDIEDNSIYCKFCGYNLKEKKFDAAVQEFEKEYKRKYKAKVSATRKQLLLTLVSVAILLFSIMVISYFAISRVNEIFTSPQYEVKNTIKSWKNSWEAKDIKKLSAFFSEDYIYDGKDRRNIKKPERIRSLEGTFRNYRFIEINIKDLQINEDEDSDRHYTATFFQEYVSDKFRDSGEKTLKLRQNAGGNWEIYREYFE